jgi:uncharacterized membrane protein
VVLTGDGGGVVGVVPPITWSVLVQYMKSVVQNTKSVMTNIVFMINYLINVKDYQLQLPMDGFRSYGNMI